MTLKTKTFAVITGFAIIPLVFSFSVFLINNHINLDNSAIEQRFIISKWIEMEFYPSVYRMRTEDLKIPEGIELCLINERGFVEYSNIPLIPPGSYFSIIFPKFYESIKGRDSKSITESFIIDGRKWHFFLIYSRIPPELEKEKFFILVKTLQFTFFIIAAGTILGSIFIGSILKSVNRLESAVKKIADGNLDFQLEVKGSDEFAALSSSFEKMRETLKDDHVRKSRFLMAVSHDLNTPLTSIKGYLEAINDVMASDAQT
ncbi:MAG: HAMP domain-containing protein, partial [Spirochaetia bacterium]|nr:HAMP domain-containing protein [Spirochaetia bacterium]